MENTNIVRKIRLNKLGCYDFKSVKEEKLSKFIEKKLMKLIIVKLKNYPKYIMFFNRQGKNIFQYDLKYNDLHVSGFVWEVLEIEFEYDFLEIRYLINDVMEKTYKMKETRPTKYFYLDPNSIEDAYKSNSII